MPRQCYRCRRNIDNEPALKGAHDVLCFPCKYHLDEAGGEAFSEAKVAFDVEYALWTTKFGQQWQRFQARHALEEQIGAGAGFALIAAIFLAFFAAPNFRPAMVSVGVMVVLGLCSAIAHWFAERTRCQPPPASPAPEKNLLSGEPELVFDEAASITVNPQFNKFSGYPPDWEQRRELCLSRDSNVCRLCGSDDRLNVHHVWPVSYSSNHTLQNLITLCHKCHYKQGYWNHRALVRENIHANTRYYVKGYTRKDGVTVKGHKKKIGRRGNFWKGVRQARDDTGHQE